MEFSGHGHGFQALIGKGIQRTETPRDSMELGMSAPEISSAAWAKVIIMGH